MTELVDMDQVDEAMDARDEKRKSAIAKLELELAKGLPRSGVKERKGAGNMTLSYVDQHYVISRLIEVFGATGFDTETKDLTLICEDEIDGKWNVAYRSTVKLTATVDNWNTVSKEGSGYGSGRDRSRGAAHESALKEAETDALKRAARLLGNSLGLALYEKEQSGVVDEPGTAPKTKGSRKPAPALDAADASALDNALKAATTVEQLNNMREAVFAFRETEFYPGLLETAKNRKKELS